MLRNSPVTRCGYKRTRARYARTSPTDAGPRPPGGMTSSTDNLRLRSGRVCDMLVGCVRVNFVKFLQRSHTVAHSCLSLRGFTSLPMDLYFFRLPLLFLAIFGCCCDGSPLLLDKTNGVIGKNVTFETSLTSSSDFITVIWNFNNDVPIVTHIPKGNKVNIPDQYANRITYNTSTCALQLRQLVKEDGGKYALSIVTTDASGQLSQLSDVVVLEVLEPVTDVKISSSIPEAVEINSTVDLTCTAKGSFTYKWINGSNPVVADGTHIKLNENVLTISEVHRTDLLGPIYCIAENALESGKSAPFNLTVSYGPENIVMTQTPADSFLKKDSNVTFTCSAKSDPLAQFQWMLNGVEISQQANMTIPNLEEKHSGNYTCVASNTKTKRVIASQVAAVSVVEPLSGTDISKPTSPLIAGNSTVDLTCTAAAGKADSVEWLKKGVPVVPDQRVSLSSDERTLSFVTVLKQDAGEYKCQLKNKVNSDEAGYVMVVNYGPENVKVNGKNTVKFDDPIDLSCIAESVPPSTYTWKFNGSTIMNVSLEKYHIEKASVKDSGTYTCEAYNPLTGLTTNTTLKLTVTELDTVDNGLSGGAIAGIVIGVLVAVIIIACIVCRRKKTTDIPSPY